MNQALNAGLYLDESSKIGDSCHRAVHAISGLQRGRDRIPRVRQKLFHAHRDTLLFGVNLEHLGLDLLSNRKHVFRLVYATPGDVADVEQRVHAAYIHKCPIAGEAAHLARAPFPLL